MANADNALASEISKAQAAADADEEKLANTRTALDDAKSNAAEKQKVYNAALEKVAKANDVLTAGGS